MSNKRELKQCTLEEIEAAIAKAISEVTGHEANATITSFKSVEVNPALHDKDKFSLDLTLDVGRNYDSPW
ncbi:hypothetical protein K6675_004665 [Vibrio parahaemolyticus]|uniref:hypothetical protein n=1 Tax=Vibrio TaxID=662 RepID=UPI0005F141B8|nr:MULTISPECIES: hypothetical protein [Vibrio]EGR0247548.1 hypothetical protein [Vibrio parahaemolyticus]EHI9243193.1 hypothetical protein [Vibrio vulnificus]EHK9101372.1 hypothetical protein [Vibrio parahaemolyticus]EIA1333969.1 hypothetical protein [Vibrio parahaemolyticus]EJE8567853.1 hypothetical protein [Vibrio parahaemolyticus]